MANYCYYEMKVKGRQEDVNIFLKRMRWEDGENTIGRVFSADEFDKTFTDDNPDTIGIMSICGDCAWSVQSAMIDGYSTSKLIPATKELNLIVEVYSEEEGCDFQEHYYIDKGEVIDSKCVDYYEEFIEDLSEEELKDRLEDGYKYKDNDEYSDYICKGGFGEWIFKLN